MRLYAPRTLMCAVAVAALGGCGSADDEAATRAAERFYSAAASEDGRAACKQLVQSAREALVLEEEKPCPEAVMSLKLSGSRVESATVWVTSAQVRLRGGDTVFLDETAQGWRVAAAGCIPKQGEEQPYQCEVES